MEKQLQIVTFEQAKRLKALNFDWSPHLYYGVVTNLAGIIVYKSLREKTGGKSAKTITFSREKSGKTFTDRGKTGKGCTTGYGGHFRAVQSFKYSGNY
jgi:hypothetical protein